MEREKGKQCLVEVTTHFHGYLRHDLFFSKDDGHDILEKLQRYCEEYNNHQFAAYALQGKIFSFIKSAKECGTRHLFASANILRSKVMSILPDKGKKDTQFLGKRTILPQRDQSAAPAKCIMWATHKGDLTDKHWVLGHFVPLLPLHASSDVPLVVVEMEDISDNTFNTGFLSESMPTGDATTVHEFYMLTWQDKRTVRARSKRSALKRGCCCWSASWSNKNLDSFTEMCFHMVAHGRSWTSSLTAAEEFWLNSMNCNQDSECISSLCQIVKVPV